jgi:hypothetical protein
VEAHAYSVDAANVSEYRRNKRRRIRALRETAAAARGISARVCAAVPVRRVETVGPRGDRCTHTDPSRWTLGGAPGKWRAWQWRAWQDSNLRPAA